MLVLPAEGVSKSHWDVRLIKVYNSAVTKVSL